jgi:hypothetical protein
LKSHDDHLLHAAINAKLAAIAGASPTPPSWHQAWSHLEPRSSDQERLAIYRAARAADSLLTDAGFFLVAWMLDLLTDQRTDARLRAAGEHLEIVRLKYGLDDEVCPEFDDLPAEYREPTQRLEAARDALYVSMLKEQGEPGMARLYREDRAQFDRRYEAGRQFFHGPESDAALEDDEWLDCPLEEVGGCLEADSPKGPLGLRSHQEEGF